MCNKSSAPHRGTRREGSGRPDLKDKTKEQRKKLKAKRKKIEESTPAGKAARYAAEGEAGLQKLIALHHLQRTQPNTPTAKEGP